MALSLKALRYLHAAGKFAGRYADDAVRYGIKGAKTFGSKVRRTSGVASKAERELFNKYNWPGAQTIRTGPKKNVFVRAYQKVEDFASPHMPKINDRWGRNAFRFETGAMIAGGSLSLHAAHSYRKDKKKLIEKEAQQLDEMQKKRMQAFNRSTQVKKMKVKRVK